MILLFMVGLVCNGLEFHSIPAKHAKAFLHHMDGIILPIISIRVMLCICENGYVLHKIRAI